MSKLKVSENSHRTSCIFCKIVKGEIPCVKIWEDKKYLAFLDLNPNTKGMTLVITKNHFDSDAIDMSDKEYSALMLVSKKIAKMLKVGLKVKRIATIMEGLGVNHVHIKLYPIYGLKNNFVETWASEKKFFEKYEGYISTQLGPEMSVKERQKIADKILKND